MSLRQVKPNLLRTECNKNLGYILNACNDYKTILTYLFLQKGNK